MGLSPTVPSGHLRLKADHPEKVAGIIIMEKIKKSREGNPGVFWVEKGEDDVLLRMASSEELLWDILKEIKSWKRHYVNTDS